MSAPLVTRFLVFDGDCSVCVSTVDILRRLGLVPEANMRAWQSFEGEASQRLWDAGIRNEMAAFDGADGEIKSGVGALLWMLEGSWARPFARVVAWKPLLAVAQVVYRTISYNRRILAPLKPGTIQCDCDPDFRVGYRWLFILLALVSATILTALFGVGVGLRGEAASSSRHALDAVVACGSGWVLAALVALRLPRESFVTWLGHQGVIMNLGLFVLVPSMAVTPFISRDSAAWVQSLSVLASFSIMLRLEARRTRAQDLASGWVLVWAISLGLALPVSFVFLGLIGWAA